jgi:hypothetical protein
MDNKLTKDEFLAFRHPEQSEQALQNMVKTIMESLGNYGNMFDAKLTLLLL